MADRSSPDLQDLARVHWEPFVPPRGRARTVLVVLGVVVVVGLVAVVTSVVVLDGPRGVGRLLANWALLPVVLAVSRRGTEVGPEGLRRRHGVVRRAWRPWEDVVEVRPPGRWDQWPVAVLDRERLDLRGVATGDVERLAAALERARRHGPGTAGRA